MPLDLDPGIEAYIEQANALYDDEAEHGSVEQQRKAYLDLCRAFATPHPPNVSTTDRVVRAGDLSIPVRVYRPAADGPLPCVVFFHGGGWVLGNLDSHDSITADIAGRTGAVVVAVDYRLAPEHPFPAAFDDSYAVLCEVSADRGAYGIDRGRIALCGDSAGGNLAAAVSLAARDRGGPKIAGQILIYPGLGAGFDLPSCFEHANAPLLTRDAMIAYWNIYMGGDPARATCYAAPALAGDLTRLPPAFISTAGNDPLRDDGKFYAERLQAVGIDAELRNAPRLVHGWLRARHISGDARVEFEAICAAIRRFLAS
jgi:acetyl esterase